MTDDMLTALERYEAEHAIPRGMLAKAGWTLEYHHNRPSMRFMTKSGPRWRYTDGQKPKYDHAPDYKACWYGLERAVKMDKGDYEVLVDCNGAASTIAAQAHGIPAFSWQSGEGTTPPSEALDELKATWGKAVYVAFDCDEAGRAGADKRVKLYRKHGIKSAALDLGLDKQGADLADYCAAHPEQTFDTLMLKCKRLKIAPEPKKAKRRVVREYTQDQADLLEMVRAALNVLSTTRRDEYHQWVEVGMACASIGDAGVQAWDEWSSHGEGYTPGLCEKKARSFRRSGISLGSLFNWADTDFGSWQWRPRRERIEFNERLEVRMEVKEAAYPSSLPVTMRGAWLTYADKQIAPILELLLEAIKVGRAEPGEPQTVECLIDVSKKLKRGLSEHTIRTGLKRAVDLGAVLFLKNDDHKVLDPGEESGSLESIGDPCRCRGRYPEWYILKPWGELVAIISKLAIAPLLQKAFPVEDETLAPIRSEFLSTLGVDNAEEVSEELERRYQKLIEDQPGYKTCMNEYRRLYGKFLRSLGNPMTAEIPEDWHYANVQEYQACIARAMVEAAGGDTQYPRAVLCERLGCTNLMLPTILNRAGLKFEKKQFVDRPAPDVAYIRSLKGWNAEAKGYPKKVVSSLKPDKPYSLGRAGWLTWAEGELAAGAALQVRFAQANRQVIVTLDQPTLKKRGRKKLVPSQVVEQPKPEKIIEPEEAVQTSFIVEPGAKPKVEQPKVVYETGKEKYRRWLRAYWLVTWAVERFIPKSKEKEPYERVWLRRLTTVATSWQVDPDRALNRETGEIEPPSIPLSISALVGAPDSVTAPSGPQSPEGLHRWEKIISQFEAFRSGALLLLSPPTTAGLLLASSLSP